MKGAAVNEQLNLGSCRWGEMASERDTCWPERASAGTRMCPQREGNKERIKSCTQEFAGRLSEGALSFNPGCLHSCYFFSESGLRI